MNNLANDLEDLYEKSEQYAKTSVTLLRLQVIDKTADVLSTLAAVFGVILFLILFGFFINISLGLYLGQLLGASYLGFLVVAGVYLVLGLLFYVFRKKWIQTPISNMIILKLLKTRLK